MKNVVIYALINAYIITNAKSDIPQLAGTSFGERRNLKFQAGLRLLCCSAVMWLPVSLCWIFFHVRSSW
jgi:hypothetical protein